MQSGRTHGAAQAGRISCAGRLTGYCLRCQATRNFLLPCAGKDMRSRPPGKVLSFRLASEGQERFTRAKTLGGRLYAGGHPGAHWAAGEAPAPEGCAASKEWPGQSAFGHQSRLQGRGPGYERWLKIHNLKEAAKTLNYLTEHNITDYELLAARAASVSENFEKTATSIKQYEHRMEQIAELKKAYHQLCENPRCLCGLPENQPQGGHGSGQPMKRSCFCTKLLNGPLTSLEKRSCRRSKPCRQNTVTCWQRKKAAYEDYKRLRKENQELQTVKANVDALLRIEQVQEYQREKENNQEQGR